MDEDACGNSEIGVQTSLTIEGLKACRNISCVPAQTHALPGIGTKFFPVLPKQICLQTHAGNIPPNSLMEFCGVIFFENAIARMSRLRSRDTLRRLPVLFPFVSHPANSLTTRRKSRFSHEAIGNLILSCCEERSSAQDVFP